MNKTYLWWKFLCLMAIINIVVWLTASWMHLEMANFSPLQVILSGIYVAVCAFRSLYLRIDLERYCLIDTPLSSVALGRSFATIAEVCFSIQCALIIHELGVVMASPAVIVIAYIIVPIIVAAQIFCWYATLTLDHFWHGVEELAWLIMVILAASCFVAGLFALTGTPRILMAIGLVSCIGCAYIMLFMDIPMYLKRRVEHLHNNMHYLTVTEGIRDALNRRIQTSDWGIWRKEAVWITSYFTVGVWLSIGMILIDLTA